MASTKLVLLIANLLVVASVVSSLDPAVTFIPAESTKADAPLFEYETKQLTDGVIAKLSAEDAKLFGFDDSAVAPSFKKRSGFCKIFPGDNDWPSQKTWDRFNELVDGALIPTIPLAAPCYRNFGVYDPEKCAAIAKNDTNPYAQ